MDALMSRNMFYVEKTVANEPDEGLANFLASMVLSLPGVMLQKAFSPAGLA